MCGCATLPFSYFSSCNYERTAIITLISVHVFMNQLEREFSTHTLFFATVLPIYKYGMDTMVFTHGGVRMKIANYEVTQQASSTFSRLETSMTKLETFVVQGNGNANANVEGQLNQPSVVLSLSDDVQNVDETKTDDLFHLSETDKAKIRLLESFISAITGKKFKFQQVVKSDKSGGKSSPETKGLKLGHHKPLQISYNRGGASEGFGGRIITTHSVSEQESMQFQSNGVVKTADGQTIEFSVNLQMARSYEMTSTTMIEFGAKLQDPLVLNFDGKGIQFGDQSLQLDINLDGTVDTFKNLALGSGFLALDQNGNGTIDDGSELFGAKTGSGFGELSAYDSDANGWIDENDAVFNSLKVWSVGADGTMTLLGLKETGVGAIYLGGVASSYQMKTGDELLGKIKQSSVYLKENGGAGTIHEIDLKL